MCTQVLDRVFHGRRWPRQVQESRDKQKRELTDQLLRATLGFA